MPEIKTSPEYIALPNYIEADWKAFAERYKDNYLHDRRQEMAKSRKCSIAAIQLSKAVENALNAQAETNIALLYDLAFSTTPLDDVISAFLPIYEQTNRKLHETPAAPLLSVNNRNAIIEMMLIQLDDITRAMGRKPTDAAVSADPKRVPLAGFTLDKLMHKWVDIRDAAGVEFVKTLQNSLTNPDESTKWSAEDTKTWRKHLQPFAQNGSNKKAGVGNPFSTPRVGNGKGVEKKTVTNAIYSEFNALWEKESSQFLAHAVQGLCCENERLHSEKMKSQFRNAQSVVPPNDIKAAELMAIASAMRTFKFGANKKSPSPFPTWLQNYQKHAMNDLQSIRDGTRTPKKAQWRREMVRSIDVAGPNGETMANIIEDRRPSDLKDRDERRVLLERFSQLLSHLDRRSRQIVILRFNMDAPEINPGDSEEKRKEILEFRNDIASIRKTIAAEREDNGKVHSIDAPTVRELAQFFPNEKNPEKSISHQRVGQIEGEAVKKLIKIARQESKQALENNEDELKEIDKIYNTYWGQETGLQRVQRPITHGNSHGHYYDDATPDVSAKTRELAKQPIAFIAPDISSRAIPVASAPYQNQIEATTNASFATRVNTASKPLSPSPKPTVFERK